MKQIPFAFKQIVVAGALFLAGCATTGIDWDRQVGEMTFDQAVQLMGTPDQVEKLDNGKLVAAWISRYDSTTPANNDNDFRYHSASESLNRRPRAAQESVLQLTFSTNNVLANWSQK